MFHFLPSCVCQRFIEHTGLLDTSFALICSRRALQYIYINRNKLIIEAATRTLIQRNLQFYLLKAVSERSYLCRDLSYWNGNVSPFWYVTRSVLHNNRKLAVVHLIKFEWGSLCVCATRIKSSVVNQNRYHAWQLKTFTKLFFSAP